MNDSWKSGIPYEKFMGRWSTPIAREFIKWLAIPPDRSWLDVGCGTGSLTRQILEYNQPREIIAIDSAPDFIAYGRQSTTDPLVRFEVGDASALDLEADVVDVVVSGLMLNFVPQPGPAIQEMLRVTKTGGVIGLFLWDYAGGMEMLRYFWDAVVELDPEARQFDEGYRFPLCREGQLESLLRDSGVYQVEARAIELVSTFQDFDDYWQPFLGRVGPAPGYVMSLKTSQRQDLEDRLRESLPVADDGSISLGTRAWAVKGLA